jgi:hypothetical protein
MSILVRHFKLNFINDESFYKKHKQVLILSHKVESTELIAVIHWSV